MDSGFPATVEEIVASGRTARVGLLHSLDSADFAAITGALAITDMEHHRQTLLNNLSGGQRQRVFIARALAGQPQILVLDEPTVGVDATAQEQFYVFLSELNKKHGLTIVLVSHDIDVVSQEVRSLVCINGTVVCSGPAKDLLTPEYLQKLYGKNVNPAFHGH
jgi:zinc transport system ATP-binding protein